MKWEEMMSSFRVTGNSVGGEGGGLVGWWRIWFWREGIFFICRKGEDDNVENLDLERKFLKVSL